MLTPSSINCNCAFPDPSMGRQCCIGVKSPGLNTRKETVNITVRLRVWTPELCRPPEFKFQLYHLTNCVSLSKLLNLFANSVSSCVKREIILHGVVVSRAEFYEHVESAHEVLAITKWQCVYSAHHNTCCLVST